MPTKPKWVLLSRLIREYADACRADEIKGGGDPQSIPEIEMELEQTRTRLERYIDELKKEQT